MPARSYAFPAAPPISAEFHVRVARPPRSVRLAPRPTSENVPSSQDLPHEPTAPQGAAPAKSQGSVVLAGVAIPSPATPSSSTVAPASVTASPSPSPAPAAPMSGSTAPAAVATPPPQTPPSSREILLPGRKISPEEERQRQQEREQFAQLISALRSAVAELQRQQQQRLHEWQRAAIELALTMASRLLYERIQSGEFPIDARVREMVAQLENEPVIAIRLHPQDLKLLEQRLKEQPLWPEGEQPRFIADATLARGECRVEGRETILLSDVVRQLEEIRDELLRSLGHARS
ncbi:MAG: FliH/SctL family protein [Thermogemmata sp.]